MAPEAAPAWQRAARRRRRVLLATVAALALAAAGLGHAAGIQSPLALALVTLLLAWTGIGLVTAAMGAWVALRGDRHALQPPAAGAPIHRDARTAIVMPICNEALGTVFGGLRATCESLAATGALALFDVYILSDSTDPALRRAEYQAWQTLRHTLGDGPGAPGGRIFIRWRRQRHGRKAGNVADFCRRWGRRYRYMVVLDADSTMAGDTLVSLVRLMEQHPRAGIVQTLPQPVGHDTLHARAQQFGARLTGRLFAQGMAYWQLGDSHYWGHNAILRVEPFMAHCRLAPLPGRGGLSGAILSHDFVEAALMRRAGYEVWVLPQLGGSWEQTPPHLLDELQRDRRWCQGNLQNARLIAEPGWQPAHRAMFATGALSYAVAPVWLALLVMGWVATRTDGGSSLASALLWGLTALLLLMPRALGLAAAMLQGRHREHGGRARMVASAALEAAVSAFQAPVRMLAHTAFVLGALTGLRLEWRSPARDTQGVAWADAWAGLSLLTVPVIALAVLAGPAAMPWHWLPVLLPLVLAVPVAVLTGHAGVGRAVRRWGLLTVAEEHRPPAPLASARHARAFTALQPRPAPAPVPRALPQPHRGAWAGGATTLLALAWLPGPAQSPQHDGPPALAWAWNTPPAHAAATRPGRLAAEQVATGRAEPRRLPRAVAERPARFIDEAVRARAAQAVAAALAREPDAS